MRTAVPVIWLEASVAMAMAAIALFGMVVIRAPSSSAAITQFQAQAKTACLCEQHAVGDTAKLGCWRSFRHQAWVAGGRADATACAPISTARMCFGETCFATKYNYIGTSSLRVFCEHADAAAIDRTFNNTYLRTGDTNLAAAEADRVARTIAAGGVVRVAKTTDGCAG